jgi:zinc protease
MTTLATALPSTPVTKATTKSSGKAMTTKVQEFKTPAGLKGWLVSTPDIPVLTVQLTFLNAGDKNNPKGMAGLSDFISAMMDEGAGAYDAQAFKQLLLEKNIQFRASSSSDHFSIQLRCTKDNIADLFDIMKLILFQLRFDKAAMDRIKQQMQTSLQQSLHAESTVVMDAFRQQAFPNHPYGTGTQTHLDDMPAITKEAMEQYIKDWFTQENLQITVAGAIDESQLSKHLDDILGKLPTTGHKNTVGHKDLITPGDVKVVDMDIPQSVIVFYQPGIARSDPDFYATYILCKILGDGGFKSRLWDEVREKRGLAYYIDADLKWSPHANYLVGSTGSANASVKEVIDLIRQEWEKILEKGVTQEELDFVKERMIGSYPLGFTSTKQIAGVLNQYQQDGLAPDFIAQRNNYIKKIALDDVNRVAKKLIQPKNLSFIVVGKPEGILSKGISSTEPVATEAAAQKSTPGNPGAK